MLFYIAKSRVKHKLIIKVITFCISSHLIILSPGCTSSTIQSENKSRLSLNTSEKNVITFVQSKGINSTAKTTPLAKRTDKEETKNLPSEVESLQERHLSKASVNNNTKTNNCSTTETFTNQSINENMYIEDQNKTYTSWFKVISKYFVLSENATSYLGLDHGLDGFQIVNHTLYLNLTKHNPVFIWTNFSQNHNISFELEGNYIWHSNRSLTKKSTKDGIKIDNLEFVYPLWSSLNKTERDVFLQLAQGSSRRQGKSTSIGLTLYLVLLLCFGIPGNLLTCCIILTNSYMRTAPNFFLLNILIADIFTLVLGKQRASFRIVFI